MKRTLHSISGLIVILCICNCSDFYEMMKNSNRVSNTKDIDIKFKLCIYYILYNTKLYFQHKGERN